MLRVHVASILSLIGLAAVTPSVAAQSTPPICTSPLSTAVPCRIHLASGQKTIVVVAQIPSRVPTEPAPGTPRRAFVSSDACCVDSAAVPVEPGGYVGIRWSSAEAPKDSVRISVMTTEPDGVLGGMVVLIPPQSTPVQLTLNSSSISKSHIWLRNEFVPTTTRIRINASDSITCEKVRFQFRPRLNGVATPDTGRAVWRDRKCVADTRWKLGDAAGQQEMDVTIGGDKGIAAQRVEMLAYGRQGPRLAAGLGYFRQIVRNQSFLCTARTDHSGCATVETFPKKITTTHRANGTEPFFALEFPLLSYRRGRGPAAQIIRHTRIVAGTTFNNPEDNPFLGVALFPMIRAASEEIPFQLSVGTTVNGPKNPYVGLSLDASGIVSSILKVLGAG